MLANLCWWSSTRGTCSPSSRSLPHSPPPFSLPPRPPLSSKLVSSPPPAVAPSLHRPLSSPSRRPMAAWQFIDTDETLEEDMRIEMEERRKEKEKNRRLVPDAKTVSTWRWFLVRLDKLSQLQHLQQQLLHWKSQAAAPDLCKHDNVMLCRQSANEWASQVVCIQCERIVIDTHTKDGIIAWMRKHEDLVKKKKPTEICLTPAI